LYKIVYRYFSPKGAKRSVYLPTVFSAAL